MITDAEIREIFIAAGFKIKDGHDDLKPYVYAAARGVIGLERNRAVAHCDAMEAKYCNAKNRYEDGLYDAAMVIGARIRAQI